MSLGGECSTSERESHWPTIFWLEKRKERDHLGDLGVDGKILKSILQEQGGMI
jgi:hypothetical protein